MTSQPGFKQSLTLYDATMMVIGCMIGSGIFIVSAEISRTLGATGYLLLAWFAAGIITLIAALSYGELAGMMPRAGGQYAYLVRAYNPLVGFLYGWTLFTVIQTGTNAAVATAFIKYTAVFFPALGEHHIFFSLGGWNVSVGQIFAVGIIVLLTWINLQGVRHGKIIQTVFTSAKVLAVILLILAGYLLGSNAAVIKNNFSEMWKAGTSLAPLSGMALISAMGVSMVGPLFANDAWNNITFIAGEVKNPKRNIPLSLFIGTLIVTVLYVATNLVYLTVLPMKGDPLGTDILARGIQYATDDRVATAVTSVIFGGMGVYVMAALVMVSTFGSNNGSILSGPRVYYAMAEDGVFFKDAAKLNKNGVPGKALIFQCIWASVLCLSGTYHALLDYVIFAALLFYILTITGIFILRKKEPATERPYKAFGYPVIPALYIFAALFICITLFIYKPENTWPGLFIVLLGIPVYYFLKRKNQPVKS